MPDQPTKTIQVRIELPEELHAKLTQEAEEDERPLPVYIVRALRGLRPRAATPVRQTAPYPTGPATFQPSGAVTFGPIAPLESNPLAEPLPEPPSPTDDLPIEQWDNDRLVNTLIEKRTAAQEERARIATIPNPKEQEQAKLELERALVFIGVLEREFNKRRVKQPKKAPQPPRANPQPRLS